MKMKKKILLTIAMCLILSVGMTACGSKEKSTAVQSTNKVISVTPTDGYVAKPQEGYEQIMIFPKDKQDDNNTEYIQIDAVDPDGTLNSLVGFTLKGYKEGTTDYTMDKLNADLDAKASEEKASGVVGTFDNKTCVKLGEVDYVKFDLTRNGADANEYYGVVDGTPVYITVVGLIDKDGVSDMLNSIEYKINK